MLTRAARPRRCRRRGSWAEWQEIPGHRPRLEAGRPASRAAWGRRQRVGASSPVHEMPRKPRQGLSAGRKPGRYPGSRRAVSGRKNGLLACRIFRTRNRIRIRHLRNRDPELFGDCVDAARTSAGATRGGHGPGGQPPNASLRHGEGTLSLLGPLPQPRARARRLPGQAHPGVPPRLHVDRRPHDVAERQHAVSLWPPDTYRRYQPGEAMTVLPSVNMPARSAGVAGNAASGQVP